MMAVAVIASIATQGLKVAKENIANSKMLWLIFAITLYAIFSYFYHGLSSREIRAFIALSVFLPFFPKDLLTKRLLIILTIIGSFVSFMSAFYYSSIIDLNRAHWPINAIPFATIVATLSLLSLNLRLIANSKPQKNLLLISFLFSIIALVLSQTRGVWIAFSISILVNIVLIVRSSKIKYDYKKILATLTLLLITIMLCYPKIEQRFQETQYDINRVSKGQMTGSIGLRLQMLAVTPDMVKGDLLLGTGNKQLEKLNRLYSEGKVPLYLYRYGPPHYHNQYADKLIKNGVIGLTLFILLLTLPLIEAKYITANNKRITTCIILLFSISALTDAPFNHGQSIFIFVLIIYALNNKPPSCTNEKVISEK
ncbi:O-antigen polymerase [Psychromonas marina]|uniref:O-antigen polymerase n=2 Tax=Psychromonas marina TaxID=88364 RepID=A0ABQ6E5C1_9GAMM|nr:O-antigen polymerase [Psychromonas marina]